MVRDFVEKEIWLYMNKWDVDEYFLVDVMKKMGEFGFFGIYILEEYGGSGFFYFEYVIVLMEFGRVCGGIGLSVVVYNFFCIGYIYYYGFEE